MFLFSRLINQFPLRKRSHFRIFSLVALSWICYAAVQALIPPLVRHIPLYAFLRQVTRAIPPIFFYPFIIFGAHCGRILTLDEPKPEKKGIYFFGTVLVFSLLSLFVFPSDEFFQSTLLTVHSLLAAQTVWLTLALYFMAWSWQYFFHLQHLFATRSVSQLIEFTIFQLLLTGSIFYLIAILPLRGSTLGISFIIRITSSFFLFNYFQFLHSTLYLDPWPHAFNILPLTYCIFWSF